MINFKEFFEDNYQLYLKDIDYKALSIDPIVEKIDVKIKDDLCFFDNKDKKTLEFEVKRTVDFYPDALYKLSIEFGAKLKVKNEAPILDSIDWKKEFKENEICINMINGLIARISVLISQITSSYGQVPLVTPPSFIY